MLISPFFMVMVISPSKIRSDPRHAVPAASGCAAPWRAARPRSPPRRCGRGRRLLCRAAAAATWCGSKAYSWVTHGFHMVPYSGDTWRFIAEKITYNWRFIVGNIWENQLWIEFSLRIHRYLVDFPANHKHGRKCHGFRWPIVGWFTLLFTIKHGDFG